MALTGRAACRRLMAGAMLAIAGVPPAVARSPAPARAAAQDRAAKGLLAADDARFAALVAKDVAAVAAAMADDCLYTHANGRIQTKAAFVAALEGGGPAYRAITTRDRTARVFGDVGMVHGIRIATVGEMALSDSYLAVYVRRDGRWLLQAWQTSPAPPAADAGPPRGR